ncbi:MAG: hypothetical protein ACYCPP_01790 [Nitrososphaerales archaeon]
MSKPVEKQSLESKKYEFTVDGSMPTLEFEITAGKEREHLHLELYNPLSNEIFEAKFAKGRIEVDKDGSVTYFSTSTDQVNVSLFLGRNLQISLKKSGEVVVRSPSKIVSIESDIKSQEKSGEVTSDTISFNLE